MTYKIHSFENRDHVLTEKLNEIDHQFGIAHEAAREGGQGSGNFGHSGIPGHQGGSQPTGSDEETKPDFSRSLSKSNRYSGTSGLLKPGTYAEGWINVSPHLRRGEGRYEQQVTVHRRGIYTVRCYQGGQTFVFRGTTSTYGDVVQSWDKDWDHMSDYPEEAYKWIEDDENYRD